MGGGGWGEAGGGGGRGGREPCLDPSTTLYFQSLSKPHPNKTGSAPQLEGGTKAGRLMV